MTAYLIKKQNIISFLFDQAKSWCFFDRKTAPKRKHCKSHNLHSATVILLLIGDGRYPLVDHIMNAWLTTQGCLNCQPHHSNICPVDVIGLLFSDLFLKLFFIFVCLNYRFILLFLYTRGGKLQVCYVKHFYLVKKPLKSICYCYIDEPTSFPARIFKWCRYRISR